MLQRMVVTLSFAHSKAYVGLSQLRQIRNSGSLTADERIAPAPLSVYLERRRVSFRKDER